MSHPAGVPPHQPPGGHPHPGGPPRRRRPVLAIIGALVLLVGLVLGGVGAVVTLGPVRDLADQPDRTAPSMESLRAGESVGVWSTDPTTTCEVRGPDGQPVDDSGVATQSASWGGRELTRVHQIDASQDGEHSISCSGPYVVGTAFSTGGIVLAGLGGLGCCLGSVLLLVGLAIWAIRRNRGP